MMTTITITQLKIYPIIGTKKEERQSPQEILVDIAFDYDARAAAVNDDIHSAIDYESLSNQIIQETEKTEFYLIEKLADYILRLILKDKRIKKAKVQVTKPNALAKAQSVSVNLSGKKV